jgi:hypothetical protein
LGFRKLTRYPLTRDVTDTANSFGSQLFAQLPARRYPSRSQRRKFIFIHALRTRNRRFGFQSNILIGDDGQALLTDFGLSNVIEEVFESEPSMRNSRFATSLFAGSTRWMAPELIEALTNDDDDQPPPISTSSDVYAFACVCLEVGSPICLFVSVC